MAECSHCGVAVNILRLSGGLCPDCSKKALAAEKASRELKQEARAEAEAVARKRSDNIILTTETAHNLPVADRLDIVTAEVVIGMNLFKDIFSAFSDTFGGRSKTMQEGLRQARQNALTELRREAHALGADAVVGVDLDYSEISGGGKSMLFLVASGTAVTLHKAASA